jgi:phospholipid/cholesterol/gamma-HCH transport system ATP-binding protein
MIKIKELYKKFDNQLVLKGVNLEIRKGETLVIMGQSGCGKSVLLKHMIGILDPDQGVVEIDGISLAELSTKALDDLRRKVGMLFQGAALFDSLNVRQNVGFTLYENDLVPKEEIMKIVREKLSLVGLSDVEEQMPSALSGGMQKRVGLARAICHEPKIILYDEPTTGLDPINADIINNLILRMQKKLGVTSVVVTHDMTSAFKVADRIAMLYHGKIIEVGTTEEIRNTKNPIIKQFITGSADGPITQERKN